MHNPTLHSPLNTIPTAKTSKSLPPVLFLLLPINPRISKHPLFSLNISNVTLVFQTYLLDKTRTSKSITHPHLNPRFLAFIHRDLGINDYKEDDSNDVRLARVEGEMSGFSCCYLLGWAGGEVG